MDLGGGLTAWTDLETELFRSRDETEGLGRGDAWLSSRQSS